MSEQQELYKKSNVKISQEIINIKYKDNLNSVNPDFDFISQDNKEITGIDKIGDTKLYDLMICDKIDNDVIYDLFNYDKTEFFKCLNGDNIIELPEFLKKTKETLKDKVEEIKTNIENKVNNLLFDDDKIKPYFIYCLRNLLLYYNFFLVGEKSIFYSTLFNKLRNDLQPNIQINGALIPNDDIDEEEKKYKKIIENNERIFKELKNLISFIIEYCRNVDEDTFKIDEIIEADENLYIEYKNYITKIYDSIDIKRQNYTTVKNLNEIISKLYGEITFGKKNGYETYKKSLIDKLPKNPATNQPIIPQKPSIIDSANLEDVIINFNYENFYPTNEIKSIYIKNFQDTEGLYIKWIVYLMNTLRMLTNIINLLESEHIINVNYIKCIFFFYHFTESIENNNIYNKDLTTNIQTIIETLKSINEAYVDPKVITDQDKALDYNNIVIPANPPTQNISKIAEDIKNFFLNFDFNFSLDDDELNTLLDLLNNSENILFPTKNINNSFVQLSNKLNGQLKEFYNFSTNNYFLTLFYDDKDITTLHSINSGLLNFPVHRIYIASQYYNSQVFNALRKNKKYVNIKIENGRFYFIKGDKNIPISFLNFTNDILNLLYGHKINQDFNTLFIDNETFKLISENEEEKRRYIEYKNQVDEIKNLAISNYKSNKKASILDYISDIKLILTSEQIKTESSQFNKINIDELISKLNTKFITDKDSDKKYLRDLNKIIIELVRLQKKVKDNTEKDYEDYLSLKEKSETENKEIIGKILENYKINFKQDIKIIREDNEEQKKENEKKLYNFIALFYDFLTNKILVNTKSSEIYDVFTDKFTDFITILFSVLNQNSNHKLIQQYEKTVREFLKLDDKIEITDLNIFLLNRQKIIERCTGIIIFFISKQFYNIPLNDDNFTFISEILNKVNDYYSEFEDFIVIKGQKITIDNSNRQNYLDYQSLLKEKEKLSEEFKNTYLNFLNSEAKEDDLTKIILDYNVKNKEIEEQEDIILNVKYKESKESEYDEKFNDEIREKYLNKLVDVFEKFKELNENNGNKEINSKINEYIDLLKEDKKDNKNLIKSVLYDKHKNYINPRVGQRLTNQEIKGYNNLLSDSLFDLIKSNQIKKGDYFLLSKTGNIKNAYIYLLNDFNVIDNNSCFIKINNGDNPFDVFSKIQEKDDDIVKTIKKYKNNTCVVKSKLNEIGGKININFLGKYKLTNQ